MAMKKYFVSYTYSRPVPLNKPEKRIFNNALHISDEPMNGNLIREIISDLTESLKATKLSIINIIPLEES